MLLGAALSKRFAEVELPIGNGGVKFYHFQTNSECCKLFLRSEGWGAKVPVQEGNNPDHLLRPLNMY